MLQGRIESTLIWPPISATNCLLVRPLIRVRDRVKAGRTNGQFVRLIESRTNVILFEEGVSSSATSSLTLYNYIMREHMQK